MATVYTKEDLEELNRKVKEEEEMEEKKNTFLNKVVSKVIDVKDFIVDDIKSNPEYYKGYATAAIGGLAGAVIAHKIIKSGLKKHGYVSIGRTRDDELTMIEYGYTGLLGKHKYLTVTDTNENMVALAERLLCVAKGSITSTTTF